MGLSETILAAMIGAMATVSAAIFQIFSSIKSRNKIDVKPRKGSTMRSMFAVLALMVASGVGGFLYSELLKQRDGEDMRAMRMELRELKELTAAARAPVALVTEPAPMPVPTATPVKLDASEHRVESVAYVPACRKLAVAVEGSSSCSEAEAQRIALCGSIPAYARIAQIELFAQPDAVQKPWGEHRVAFEQDLGGARFTGKSFEYAQGSDLKAVCVNFVQWSSEHSHIARVVLNYGFGSDAAGPASDQHPLEVMQTASESIVTADSLPAMPQQASFVTSIKP
jgi:hypothetical protein